MATVDTAQLALKLLGPRQDFPNSPEYRPVRILNDIVVNQIAAGEVVERPSSVVKELVENAIDAGSTNILVVLENGGQSSIEVIDNGCGMSKDDALLALERFGTSKLETAHDLLGIATLGFRGEALPSIASVSRLTLSTARESGDSGVGTEIRIEGGKLRDVTPKQLPPGTRILVRQLFYNVPARKKFLRSERSETGAVRALMADFAAAYPKIRFRLVADGQELMNLPACANFYDRAAMLTLAGNDPLEIETSLASEDGPYVLTGVLSKPRDCVVGAGRLRLLVNGRSVRDRVLLKAVRDAYGNFLKGDRYPSGVLRLEVPPTDVDVNVHPQKTEIRFRASDMIFRLVRSGISAGFRRANIVSTAFDAQGGNPYGAPSAAEALATQFSGDSGVSAPFAAPDSYASERISSQQSPITFFRTIANPFPLTNSAAPVTFLGTPREVQAPLLQSDTNARAALQLQNYRYLGQIFDCYLLFEEGERLVVVDMHAAHERVTHARLLAQFQSGNVQAQLLLMPEHIELQPGEMERFLLLCPVLERLGFDCERFSAQTAIVRSVPAILFHASPRSMMLDLLSLEEHRDWQEKISQWVENAVARLACHGSVRSGRKLEREEAYALLESIQSTEVAAFCPHGRPVMLSLTEGQIETMFGRA